jgi:hypothetical protein
MTRPQRAHDALRQLGATNNILSRPRPHAHHAVRSEFRARLNAHHRQGQQLSGRARVRSQTNQQEGPRQPTQNTKKVTHSNQRTKLQYHTTRDEQRQQRRQSQRASQSPQRQIEQRRSSQQDQRGRSCSPHDRKAQLSAENGDSLTIRAVRCDEYTYSNQSSPEKRKRPTVADFEGDRRTSKKHQSTRMDLMRHKQPIYPTLISQGSNVVKVKAASIVPRSQGQLAQKSYTQLPSPISKSHTKKQVSCSDSVRKNIMTPTLAEKNRKERKLPRNTEAPTSSRVTATHEQHQGTQTVQRKDNNSSNLQKRNTSLASPSTITTAGTQRQVRQALSLGPPRCATNSLCKKKRSGDTENGKQPSG